MQARELFEKNKNIIQKNQFEELIMHIKKISSKTFLYDIFLSKTEIKKFNKYLNKIKKDYPLEYITKKKYFFENDFFVNKKVLIPRPESELLVEELLKYDLIKKIIIDICCGSGCIGISIKLKNKNADLFLSDISKQCLKVTKKNLKRFNIEAKVYKEDFLNVIFKNNLTPDFLVINPPYIEIDDKNIGTSTLKHEPSLALFADQLGYKFYNILFADLDRLFLINKNLVIICEFGFNQKEQLELNFEKYRVKYKIEFNKDYSGHWRYFKITNKETYD
ncbi:peptide chain release factor N(5)-glutamine methyltransferase [Spiroplasma tabanidicola]|uniref:peptide chain release factor N(5)-glutamine methyltransferase n=1 Tax=Spiroplasma tabanidicola TaxID=324079 RepID=A0A6I6C864_9MOLU|nr:peptide chain release factor N(5)-glutamine methyltransferase [Spiroplasma tabanidicola]QGS52420.1 release factor glutamine methyltransferase [Spiroplasma tabanidicola]